MPPVGVLEDVLDLSKRLRDPLRTAVGGPLPQTFDEQFDVDQQSTWPLDPAKHVRCEKESVTERYTAVLHWRTDCTAWLPQCTTGPAARCVAGVSKSRRHPGIVLQQHYAALAHRLFTEPQRSTLSVPKYNKPSIFDHTVIICSRLGPRTPHYSYRVSQMSRYTEFCSYFRKNSRAAPSDNCSDAESPPLPPPQPPPTSRALYRFWVTRLELKLRPISQKHF